MKPLDPARRRTKCAQLGTSEMRRAQPMTTKRRGRSFRFPPAGARPAELKVTLDRFVPSRFSAQAGFNAWQTGRVSLQRLVNVKDDRIRTVHDFGDDIV
jgi:hypothetical protein